MSHVDDVIRLKKPSQRKKYGLLLNDSVEMEEVETDEDDTLFEARSLRRSATQLHNNNTREDTLYVCKLAASRSFNT